MCPTCTIHASPAGIAFISALPSRLSDQPKTIAGVGPSPAADCGDVVRATVATAFLSLEAQGVISLRSKRITFAELPYVHHVLEATRLQSRCECSVETVEHALFMHMRETPTRICEVVEAWLGAFSPEPLADAAGRMTAGTLGRREPRRSKLPAIPAESRPGLAAVWELLERCKENRPEVFDLLLQEAQLGFDRLTVYTAGDYA